MITKKSLAIEFIFWSLLSSAGFVGIFVSTRFNKYTISGTLAEKYPYVVLSLSILFIPVVIYLLSGKLPLTALRSLLVNHKARSSPRDFGDSTGASNEANAASPREKVSVQRRVEHPEKSAIDNLQINSRASRSVAVLIFRRGVIHLLFGLFMAISGLIFFSSTFGINDETPTEITAAVVSLAPRFGILFFIEFIALFFLRQYRTSMEEYRYYDGIARSREEMIVAFFLLDSADGKNLVEAVQKGAFSSKTSALAPGHSTEVLEARKLEGSDFEGLAKILEGLAAFKK